MFKIAKGSDCPYNPRTIPEALPMSYLRLFLILPLFGLLSCNKAPPAKPGETGYERPNFLFIVTDDQSWKHTSFAGYPYVSTPNFDRIASHGVYFRNAYAPSASCTASRSSILTGQYPWRLKSGAVLGGLWPEEIPTFQSILHEHGYHTGYTGKGWGPGRIATADFHPEGHPYYQPPYKEHIWQRTPHPYATSLELFLEKKTEGQPFSFWIGASEPHRPYNKVDLSRFRNAKPKQYIPGFLPAIQPVKEDMASYLTEIEKFDAALGQVIKVLKKNGVYENTIIVVTSDNGMPFSRAKTQNYEYGVKVPLAILWPRVTQGHNRVDDVTGLYDIAPTFLDAAEIPLPEAMNGKSLLPVLYSNSSGLVDKNRTAAITAVERHSYEARPDHLGYPSRAIHTLKYSYIYNFFPDRWPTGDNFEEAEAALLVNPETNQPVEPFFSLTTAKRPQEELYDLSKDPLQFHNQLENPAYKMVLNKLRTEMRDILQGSGDPVFLTGKDVFSQYPWENSKNP